MFDCPLPFEADREAASLSAFSAADNCTSGAQGCPIPVQRVRVHLASAYSSPQGRPAASSLPMQALAFAIGCHF